MTVIPRHPVNRTCPSTIPRLQQKRKLSPMLSQPSKQITTTLNSVKKTSYSSLKSRNVPKRKSPVMMSTPTMTKSGLFSTPVAIKFNPRQTPVSGSKVKRLYDNIATKNLPTKNAMSKTPLIQRKVNRTLDYSLGESSNLNVSGSSNKVLLNTTTLLHKETHNTTATRQVQTADKSTQTHHKHHLKTQRRSFDKTAERLHPSKRRLFSNKQLSSGQITSKDNMSAMSVETLPAAESQNLGDSPSVNRAKCKEHQPFQLDLCKNDSLLMLEIKKALPLMKSKQINLNDLVKDCIKNHKLQKNSREGKQQKCACIFCVMENSTFILSPEMLFKAFVKFLFKVFSCMDVKFFHS